MAKPEMLAVDGVAKRYQIRHQAAKRRVGEYGTLREAIATGVQRVARTVGGGRGRSLTREDFWALNDVSFCIREGEAVGIIGRNGAGKSTLLKVLSKITEPTRGRIWLGGRVASLLEVGTGFHPELTGRENIYLNGVILGMKRHEVRRKFDEIVSFAEVEQFLDTPVKRYSSGMYVRLAFAVAAHLEPEILLVDEVLAVGDAAFQKKCLGKMDEVAREQGRTLLFVSHNMSSISALCSRGILLDQGRVVFDGPAGAAVRQYAAKLDRSVYQSTGDRTGPHITTVAVDEDDLGRGIFRLRVGYEAPETIKPNVGVVVSTIQGTPLFGTNGNTHPAGFAPLEVRRGESIVEVNPLPLHSGMYKVSVWLSDFRTGPIEHRPDAVTFDFVAPRFIANLPSVDVIGPFHVEASWSMSGDS